MAIADVVRVTREDSLELKGDVSLGWRSRPYGGCRVRSPSYRMSREPWVSCFLAHAPGSPPERGRGWEVAKMAYFAMGPTIVCTGCLVSASPGSDIR